MADTERLEAIGPRGEACIIIRNLATPSTPPSGDAADEPAQPSYRLATGERLATTDNPAVFETLDRSRRFTLRQP
jgi:hypothetical protein